MDVWRRGRSKDRPCLHDSRPISAVRAATGAHAAAARMTRQQFHLFLGPSHPALERDPRREWPACITTTRTGEARLLSRSGPWRRAFAGAEPGACTVRRGSPTPANRNRPSPSRLLAGIPMLTGSVFQLYCTSVAWQTLLLALIPRRAPLGTATRPGGTCRVTISLQADAVREVPVAGKPPLARCRRQGSAETRILRSAPALLEYSRAE
jgi:hypothetical protein